MQKRLETTGLTIESQIEPLCLAPPYFINFLTLSFLNNFVSNQEVSTIWHNIMEVHIMEYTNSFF